MDPQANSAHCRLSAENQDLHDLRRIGVHLYVELPVDSIVLHQEGCWDQAKWDAYPAKFAMQLWCLNYSGPVQPTTIQQQLGDWSLCRYNFHWDVAGEPPPEKLVSYREHQQAALWRSWEGLVAGTDGSVAWKSEHMGAGYVAGSGPLPCMQLSAPVGGPLASLRAEAASLLYLLRNVAESYSRQKKLYSCL